MKFLVLSLAMMFACPVATMADEAPTQKTEVVKVRKHKKQRQRKHRRNGKDRKQHHDNRQAEVK